MAKKILITSGDSWTAGSIGGINALRQSAPHPFILKDAVSFKNEEKLWPEGPQAAQRVPGHTGAAGLRHRVRAAARPARRA